MWPNSMIVSQQDSSIDWEVFEQWGDLIVFPEFERRWPLYRHDDFAVLILDA
jgi:hypothetical protein